MPSKAHEVSPSCVAEGRPWTDRTSHRCLAACLPRFSPDRTSSREYSDRRLHQPVPDVVEVLLHAVAAAKLPHDCAKDRVGLDSEAGAHDELVTLLPAFLSYPLARKVLVTGHDKAHAGDVYIPVITPASMLSAWPHVVSAFDGAHMPTGDEQTLLERNRGPGQGGYSSKMLSRPERTAVARLATIIVRGKAAGIQETAAPITPWHCHTSLAVQPAATRLHPHVLNIRRSDSPSKTATKPRLSHPDAVHRYGD